MISRSNADIGWDLDEYKSEYHRMADKVDGLEADLDSVLDVLISRINGERDLPSAAVWVKLNYPEKAKAIRERKTLGMGER